MAIAITEPVAENVSTTNATTYALGAFTPTANSLLVVAAAVSGTLTTLVITDNTGLVWKPILIFVATDIFTIAYAQVGGSPASTTITATVNATATGGGICAFQVTGHDITGVTPIKQSSRKSNAASANANTLFEQDMDTNNGYISVWSGLLGAASSTPPTGWTETVDAGYISPARNVAAAFRAGGETARTITFTNASTGWTCVSIEIFAANASPLRKGLAALGAG